MAPKVIQSFGAEDTHVFQRFGAFGAESVETKYVFYNLSARSVPKYIQIFGAFGAASQAGRHPSRPNGSPLPSQHHAKKG